MKRGRKNMNELERIKNEVRIKKQWLDERNLLEDLIDVTSSEKIIIKKVGRYSPTLQVEGELKNKINHILREELELFDKEGYTKWLEKRTK